jgi:outer membrane protein assembly factor BamD (BamD/ComL family)
MAKRQLLITLIICIVTALPAAAAGDYVLQSMERTDEFDQSRLLFGFSKLPGFQLKTSGQRVDLLLHQTSVAASLKTLPEDDKIVRVLFAGKPQELLVSILLRKIPAQVSATRSATTGQITLDIRWRPDDKHRPAIAFQLSGMPAAHQTLQGIATLQQSSAYAGHWKDFFRTFATPLEISIPLRATLPPLPPLAANPVDNSLNQLLQMANAGHWQALAKKLQNSPASPSHPRLLLHAETLLRTGQPRQALRVLEKQGAHRPGDHEPLADRATYLQAVAEARCGLPYQARCTLSLLLERKPGESHLTPQARLLQAELLLTIGRCKEACGILEEPVQKWPVALQRPVQWRRAQALAATGRTGQAEQLFRRLFSRSDHWAKYADIRYHAGLASLKSGQYRQAGNLFTLLEKQLRTPTGRGKALFYAARAAYLDNDLKTALVILEQLRDNFEGSEPGFRAWLALLDHRMASDRNPDFLQTARDYATIARHAPLRPLREEAALKQALVHYLHRQPEKAARLLQGFLRNFAGGPLRKEATALLSEILPPLIENLIRNGQDMKAVTLVEENRELLIDGNLSWPFLPALAQAYRRLGLWEKACKSYYFMIDRGPAGSQDEAAYLPLVQLLIDRGQYAMAASLAERYLQKFSHGKQRDKLFELQLAALEQSKRLDEAAALLKQARQPLTETIALQGARIHWKRGASQDIIDQPPLLDHTADGQLLRAEALFHAAHEAEAYPLYEGLRQHEEYAEQATYRCAQIKLRTGERRLALKLFARLTENGNNSFWARLARDAIAAQK